MDDRQLDLFASPAPVIAPSRSEARQEAPEPSSLSDPDLISGLLEGGLRNCAVLAAEAGRRKLAAAVPALAQLCRRFTGWGATALVPEQVAGLRALQEIGGRAAASAVVHAIVRAEIAGPTLRIAVAAADALGATLPEDVALQLLRHDDPGVRALTCRCVRPSAASAALLLELLDDLRPEVHQAAACALGMMGRAEARASLIRLIHRSPSKETVEALAVVADQQGLALLLHTGEQVPALANAIVEALECCEYPGAPSVVRRLQSRP